MFCLKKKTSALRCISWQSCSV